uniref:E3 ubiquitin-protein ligase TRAIP (inferred by orthology to a human protein) n=1 Tax=Strongyloides venezuelensis TaxID=75913 RepID=A0A0K0FQL4_STRVS
MSLKIHCTICTDDFWSGTVSTCPCGHTFHEECIKKWLEHQRNCPICRQKCTTGKLTTLFFSFTGETSQAMIEEKESNSEYKIKVIKMTRELEMTKNELRQASNQLDEARSIIKTQSTSLIGYENLQKEYEILSNLASDYQNLKNECKKMVRRIKVSEFYKIVSESRDSIDVSFLDEYVKDEDGSVNVTKLLEAAVKENRRIKKVLIEKQRENNELTRRKAQLESEIQEKEEIINKLRTKLTHEENNSNVPNFVLDENSSPNTSKIDNDIYIIKETPIYSQLKPTISGSFPKINYEALISIEDDDQTVQNTPDTSILSPSRVSSILDRVIASKNVSNSRMKDVNSTLDQIMDNRASRIKRYNSFLSKNETNSMGNLTRLTCQIQGKKSKYI